MSSFIVIYFISPMVPDKFFSISKRVTFLNSTHQKKQLMGWQQTNKKSERNNR